MKRQWKEKKLDIEKLEALCEYLLDHDELPARMSGDILDMSLFGVQKVLERCEKAGWNLVEVNIEIETEEVE